MQTNNVDMIIQSSTYVSFESSAAIEPQQQITNIYIYLYVSDQSLFIGSRVFRAGIQKMLGGIAYREDPDQTASSEAVRSGSALFV